MLNACVQYKPNITNKYNGIKVGIVGDCSSWILASYVVHQLPILQSIYDRELRSQSHNDWNISKILTQELQLTIL